MKDFFENLINKLHVLTGVDMPSFLDGTELAVLINELVATGQQDPYHHITDTVKQRLIMENIYTDESLVRPPYGVKPGLNRRILTKWYKAHWEVHGNRIMEKPATPESNYKRYVEWAKREGLPVLPLGKYPNDEQVQEYVAQVGRNMARMGEV